MLTPLAIAVLLQSAAVPHQSSGLALFLEQGLTAGPSLLISVPEPDQGATDLNGDGDALDRIAHTVDLATGSAVNLRVHGDWLVASEFIGVIEEYEGWQGADLDGDGDTLDYVLHVHDVESGLTRLLPWAVSHGFFQSISLDRRRATFLVSEADSGGTDFNHDGDADDLVPFLHDARTGATANLGRASRQTGMAQGVVAFSVDEFGEGQDLDGNGFINGLVLFVLRSGATAPENTGVPMLLNRGFPVVRVQQSMVLVESPESLHPGGGNDLNGDGDLSDVVALVWDLRARRVRNLKLALEPGREALLDPSAVWVPVSEIFQGGQDLNGNGTAFEQVLHRVALPAFTAENLGLAISANSVRASAGRCAFGVDEFQQGSDLNGDGDLLDLVAHCWEPALGAVASTGRAVIGLAASSMLAEGFTFRVLEFADGHDHNGDGDQVDVVDFYWHGATAEGQSLGLATTYSVDTVDPLRRHAWIHASEPAQASTDLNGDGDAQDQRVVFACTGSTGNLLPTGLAGALLGERGRYAAVGVSEQEQGGIDLNGDGDALDRVAVLVGPLR